jgi:hypothetical protein
MYYGFKQAWTQCTLRQAICLRHKREPVHRESTPALYSNIPRTCLCTTRLLSSLAARAVSAEESFLRSQRQVQRYGRHVRYSAIKQTDRLQVAFTYVSQSSKSRAKSLVEAVQVLGTSAIAIQADSCDLSAPVRVVAETLAFFTQPPWTYW